MIANNLSNAWKLFLLIRKIPQLKAVFWPGTQNAQRTLKNAPHVDLRPPLERPVSRFPALGNGFGNW